MSRSCMIEIAKPLEQSASADFGPSDVIHLHASVMFDNGRREVFHQVLGLAGLLQPRRVGALSKSRNGH